MVNKDSSRRKNQDSPSEAEEVSAAVAASEAEEHPEAEEEVSVVAVEHREEEEVLSAEVAEVIDSYVKYAVQTMKDHDGKCLFN